MSIVIRAAAEEWGADSLATRYHPDSSEPVTKGRKPEHRDLLHLLLGIVVCRTSLRLFMPGVQKLHTVAPHICASSVWNFLHVTLLDPRILRWLPDVWKFLHPALFYINYAYYPNVPPTFYSCHVLRVTSTCTYRPSDSLQEALKNI